MYHKNGGSKTRRRCTLYWPRGWWCPRHPWPPAWARSPYYHTETTEELKALQDYKRELEKELVELDKRIEELKRPLKKRGENAMIVAVATTSEKGFKTTFPTNLDIPKPSQ